ncbi:hypothetical protein [Myxococcus eversor]|uniref:hypothetical protein n=1 Tax=Myxococcus eversor TaxID=2709661 RepID=UPI0013D0A023|nr:hypothetical protein [Myxococcus eversor]
MKRQLQQGILTMVIILPLAVVARSVPGSGGRPVDWVDGGCFLMNGSAMTNGCATGKRFEFPLVIDSAGNKTAVIAASGASSANNVGCAAAGVNREGTLVWGGTRKWMPSFGVRAYITLNDAYVPPAGYMYINCHLEPGGAVVTVDYTP